MSQPKTIIVTGGTAEFFPFLLECVESIAASGLLSRADLGVFDQGLTPEQLEILKPFGAKIHRPTWEEIGIEVPERHRLNKHLSLPGRPLLPKFFPGYEIYQWVDADAWVQTPEFFDVFQEGAMKTGLAVAQEDGFGYSPSLIDRKWWVGNYFLNWGLIGGVRGGLLKPPINNGVFAMHRDAPHWARYRALHAEAVKRTGKINHDQHALHASVALEGLPVTYVSARMNWLPVLSRPVWDAEAKLMCDPSANGPPLSIIHLAGSGKFDSREVSVRQGGAINTPLNFSAVQKLRGEASAPAASEKVKAYG